MRNANLSGHRIKVIRKQRNLTQSDVAAALELDYKIFLDRSDISEIERGVRGIKDYELDAIARILEISPLWLLRGQEQED